MAVFHLRTVDGFTSLSSIKIEAVNLEDAKLKAQTVAGEILGNNRFSPFDHDLGIEIANSDRKLVSKIVIVGFDM